MGGRPTFVDVCSGAGGLALGLEQAGFQPRLLLDDDEDAVMTLRANRPQWNVLHTDLIDFNPIDHPESYDVDLLSAGLPRVKSSATAKRAESGEEERLLRAAVHLVHAIRPRAVIIENVPDLAHSDRYQSFRDFARAELAHLGYEFSWFVVNAVAFGVPQNRKQGVLVAVERSCAGAYRPPAPTVTRPQTVGAALEASMAARGWPDAARWAAQADQPAPTLVGGSKNRGGADLGPTGAKRKWATMGVNGHTVGDAVPGPDFVWDPLQGRENMVKITVEQAALIQGFPESWEVTGRKTARYRQIGHATPPPVGQALGRTVARALLGDPVAPAAG
ncbi:MULTISPECIES: DNA cytosine methyltransferase [unclassified Streptomyces]|uniref:DNA cytosine methyltransferase n=1 Tax=unclassified Streptomyces TaxID=2593676 RepID=UPI001F2D60BF|nr:MULTISPECIES: DNA cytosine methyltransferase [unclassified Streptomyces]MCF0087638.1 putative BsuMI modification methylase subunit YdiP [Streptomyces sp. MH192]MCF0099700.1 putative BsuMI modification methylase subunit YdiP [Streptomyces sp. MH191]